MKRILSSIAAYASASLLGCSLSLAQEGILLSKYTYSPDAKVVGKVIPANPAAALPKVALIGQSARLFTIDKNNLLSFKKDASGKNKSKWHDIILEFRSGLEATRDTFRIVKDEFIVNKVIAHRGAWKNTGEAENSIGALQKAIALGCAGSEFDVHLSADEVPFVNHDPTVQGIPIDRTPAAELALIRLPNGEPLPTLEAYLLAGTQQNNTRLILEIKPSALGKERSLQLTQTVVDLVRKHKAQAWVDYISFDYDVLQKVLELDPFAKVAYLNGDKTPEELARDKFYGLDYHFNVLKKNEHWFADARQKNLTINVWTVNDEQLMDWLLEKKVDFITTNEPEKLLEKVKRGVVR